MSINEWQRPVTTRRYLHPPMSENMVTLWCEGKIIYSENLIGTYDQYFDLNSRAIWFVYGKDLSSADFKTAQNSGYDNGIPIHALTNKYGNLSVKTEAFCSADKNPICYIKVTVSNYTNQVIKENFGFLLRTAKECNFIVDAPDIYVSYTTDIQKFKDLPATWVKTGNCFSDGNFCLSISSDMFFDWNSINGSVLSCVCLNPCESKTIYLALSEGKPVFDYEHERSAIIDYWEKQLSRINKLPMNISNNKYTTEMIKNLAIQMMQCFCHYKNTDFIMARQGGLQRRVWTYETLYVLEALNQIGDFDDYIKPIIDLYFNNFQNEDGEIIPLGMQWAMSTGNVLYSFSKFAETQNKDYFLKYRNKAMLSFNWMKKMRASTKSGSKTAEGLFPPMASCDNQFVFQSWLNTDTNNLLGIFEFAKVLEQFGDKDSVQVWAEYYDYLSYMKKYWQTIYNREKSFNEIAPPYSPIISNEEIIAHYDFGASIEHFIYVLDLSEDEVEKLLNYNQNHGIMQNGLYSRMPDKARSDSTRFNLDENGKCTVWYVVEYEYHILLWYIKHGKLSKASEILESMEKYAMTDECYMIERYNQRDPYFAPWSPNASANGRMILMLLAYFNEEKNN